MQPMVIIRAIFQPHKIPTNRKILAHQKKNKNNPALILIEL